MYKSTPVSKPIKYISTVVIFAAFIFILFKYREDFYIIRDVSISQFIAASILILFTITLNGSKLNLITETFNIRLQAREWFALSSMTTVLNSVFFKAGSLATSTYLKKKYDFPYTSFVGTFLGDQLIILFMATLFGSAISLYLGLSGNTKILFVFVVFALIANLLVFLMHGKIGVPQKGNTTFDFLRHGIESLNMLLKNKNLLYSLGTHNIFLVITIGLRLLVACSILHLEIPLSHCYLFATVMIFIRAFPLTHSDIGLRELTVGFLSGILGGGLKIGVLTVAVDRIFELFWPALCATIFRNSLMRAKD